MKIEKPFSIFKEKKEQILIFLFFGFKANSNQTESKQLTQQVSAIVTEVLFKKETISSHLTEQSKERLDQSETNQHSLLIAGNETVENYARKQFSDINDDEIRKKRDKIGESKETADVKQIGSVRPNRPSKRQDQIETNNYVEDPILEQWDPKVEEFKSARNHYAYNQKSVEAQIFGFGKLLNF